MPESGVKKRSAEAFSPEAGKKTRKDAQRVFRLRQI
jgi:hypothetical protein